jgi:hypothetical protein
MRSNGCNIRVDVTPPDIPATKCSYLTWESTLNFAIFLGDDAAVGGFIAVVADDIV